MAGEAPAPGLAVEAVSGRPHVNERGTTPITVIVELRAQPGRRSELKGRLESLIAMVGPDQPGFLGSTRYEVLDDADVLVEIADWESQRLARCTCRTPQPPAPTHPCSNCWPRRSGSRSSGSRPDRTRDPAVDRALATSFTFGPVVVVVPGRVNSQVLREFSAGAEHADVQVVHEDEDG